MTYKDWLESYNGNHEQAGRDAWDIMRVYENANTALKAERDALAAHVERLRAAALDVISFVPGGEVKARLRDAYDEDPTTSLARLRGEVRHQVAEEWELGLPHLKAECWKEAYLAGMEYGHHWTVEGGYVPGDEEAAEDYVADRQAEETADGHKAD